MKKMFFFGLGLITLLFLNFLFISSIDDTTISLRYKKFHKNFANLIMPEGWAFFTRNPREEKLKIFKITSSKNFREISLNNSDSKMYFGFSRENRVTYGGFTKIIADIDRNLWKIIPSTEEIPSSINLDSLSIVSVKAQNMMPLGEFIITTRKPIPYMWYSGSKLDFKMSTNFIILKITK